MVTCHCGPLGAGEKAMRTLKQFNDRRLVVNEAEAKTVRYILHATKARKMRQNSATRRT
jgi:hypothetical protein